MMTKFQGMELKKNKTFSAFKPRQDDCLSYVVHMSERINVIFLLLFISVLVIVYDCCATLNILNNFHRYTKILVSMDCRYTDSYSSNLL